MKEPFLIIIFLFLLGFPCSIANAADSASNIRVDYSCPGKVTVTYDLTTAQPTDVKLRYSPNKSKWLDAEAVTGDVKAQTTGTSKTIVWDCFADNVRMGGFYFKIELSPPSEPECVWINGVCWATRNVDVPGTFAENPEDPGMFYQWNRKTAWPTTGSVTGWDSNYSTGTIWEKVNDPSPEGYRVPNFEEIGKLLDVTKVTSVWINQNGIPGREFTDIATGNSIFMPAVGYRGGNDSVLYGADLSGNYWLGTQHYNYDAYDLQFGSSYVSRSFDGRARGFSVRSVAED